MRPRPGPVCAVEFQHSAKAGRAAAVLRSWEFFRAPLAISAELSILSGVAVGYPDPGFSANKLHIGREAIDKNIVLLDS